MICGCGPPDPSRFSRAKLLMDGHCETDCDLAQDVFDDLPDMYSSDADGDGPDPRSRFAMPNHWQYQRAILQEETGAEDRFEGDSEVELCGRLEES